jgi:Fic family protein
VILFELLGTENAQVYQDLEISNGARQFDFLRSIVEAALAVERPFLSQHILKALNYHAIACLHTNAGEYRPCPVHVGNYNPPEHYRVQALMDDFVNFVNRRWETTDPVVLATYVLWRLNHIHPFINGNGRTARAAAYFVICVSAGGWLPGDTTLPALLSANRAAYVVALREVDASLLAGNLDLSPLLALVSGLLDQQLAPHGPPPDGEVSEPVV